MPKRFHYQLIINLINVQGTTASVSRDVASPKLTSSIT